MKRIHWLAVLTSLSFLVLFLLVSGEVQSSANPPELPAPGVPSTPPAAVDLPVKMALPRERAAVSTNAAVENTAPEKGSLRVATVDGMQQVYVPAGPFLMGSADLEAKISIDGGRAYPEIPQNTVNLDAFWIDKFEVTNGQYALCVAAGACKPPFVNYSTAYPKYYDNPLFANYPVIWVSWYKARAYCEWSGRRLPTEAEWEKAARGTDGAKYPWGNAPVDGTRANFCDKGCLHKFANPAFDDGHPDVAPVGSYPAGVSPYGAMDMAGNVSEWTSTLVRPYPYVATDGREDLDSPGERVWRSSPWRNGFWWLRASMRYRSVPTYQREVLGFRCASSE